MKINLLIMRGIYFSKMLLIISFILLSVSNQILAETSPKPTKPSGTLPILYINVYNEDGSQFIGKT